ncbi:hypothetical protein PM082_018765 [Marasmius tenuissimus]|nr:hypothetical protein PM082_018765 [Marasmius tenuissimus]
MARRMKNMKAPFRVPEDVIISAFVQEVKKVKGHNWQLRTLAAVAAEARRQEFGADEVVEVDPVQAPTVSEPVTSAGASFDDVCFTEKDSVTKENASIVPQLSPIRKSFVDSATRPALSPRPSLANIILGADSAKSRTIGKRKEKGKGKGADSLTLTLPPTSTPTSARANSTVVSTTKVANAKHDTSSPPTNTTENDRPDYTTPPSSLPYTAARDYMDGPLSCDPVVPSKTTSPAEADDTDVEYTDSGGEGGPDFALEAPLMMKSGDLRLQPIKKFAPAWSRDYTTYYGTEPDLALRSANPPHQPKIMIKLPAITDSKRALSKKGGKEKDTAEKENDTVQSVAAEPVEKKKRGRKPKAEPEVSTSAPATQSTSTASDQPPAKKRRIVKTASFSATAAEQDSEEAPPVEVPSTSTAPPAKRGRGRPRKHPLPQPVVSAPVVVEKRGRGRPRKDGLPPKSRKATNA